MFGFGFKNSTSYCTDAANAPESHSAFNFVNVKDTAVAVSLFVFRLINIVISRIIINVLIIIQNENIRLRKQLKVNTSAGSIC